MIFRARWRVPVTTGDANVFMATQVSDVSYLTRFAVGRLKRLSESCPAGGIMPEPLDGERWAFERDGEVFLDTVPDVDDVVYDLVLIDKHGNPYDPSELVKPK